MDNEKDNTRRDDSMKDDKAELDPQVVEWVRRAKATCDEYVELDKAAKDAMWQANNTWRSDDAKKVELLMKANELMLKRHDVSERIRAINEEADRLVAAGLLPAEGHIYADRTHDS